MFTCNYFDQKLAKLLCKIMGNSIELLIFLHQYANNDSVYTNILLHSTSSHSHSIYLLIRIGFKIILRMLCSGSDTILHEDKISYLYLVLLQGPFWVAHTVHLLS